MSTRTALSPPGLPTIARLVSSWPVLGGLACPQPVWAEIPLFDIEVEVESSIGAFVIDDVHVYSTCLFSRYNRSIEDIGWYGAAQDREIRTVKDVVRREDGSAVLHVASTRPAGRPWHFGRYDCGVVLTAVFSDVSNRFAARWDVEIPWEGIETIDALFDPTSVHLRLVDSLLSGAEGKRILDLEVSGRAARFSRDYPAPVIRRGWSRR